MGLLLKAGAGAFASEDAIVKQIYLATINANTKWQAQMFGWPTVRTELMNYLETGF